MWFWPYNVKAWWLIEDLARQLKDWLQEHREAAQLGELNRLRYSLEELSG